MLEALLSRESELKMEWRGSPYFILDTGREKKKSQMALGSGKNLHWENERHTFEIQNLDTDITLALVADRDGSEELVGSVLLDTHHLVSRQGLFQDWFQITLRGKDAGKISLKWRMRPAGTGVSAAQQRQKSKQTSSLF